MDIKTINNELFFKEVADRIAADVRILIRAKGNSMLPFIRDNRDEIILEKPRDSSFRRGRLLLVRLADGKYVMHRLQKVKGNYVFLRGDGNISAVERCTFKDVIAEATEILRVPKTVCCANTNSDSNPMSVHEGKSAHRGTAEQRGTWVRAGSFRWNLYRFLWPRNAFLRRICLGFYRRIPLLQKLI